MIENVQYAALRLVTGAKKGSSRELLLKDCGLCTMQNRTFINYSNYFRSLITMQGPSYLENCLPNLSGGEHRVTRSRTSEPFRLVIVHLNSFASSFYHLL